MKHLTTYKIRDAVSSASAGGVGVPGRGDVETIDKGDDAHSISTG